MNYKLLLLTTVTLLFVACGQKATTEKTAEHETLENGVEVLYFHGDRLSNMPYLFARLI